MANKRPSTQNAGAALERQAWMAKLVIMAGKSELHSIGWMEALKELNAYGKGRTARDNKTPGGLGKKAVAKK